MELRVRFLPLSVKVMAWVFEFSESEGNDRLVLLALADRADETGFCWPGVTEIARKARVSDRTAQRSLATLQALGELVIEHRTGGRNITNRYRIICEKGCQSVTLSEEQKGDTIGKRVTNQAEKGDTGVTRYIIDPSVIIREDEKGEPQTPYSDQGGFKHFLGKQLRGGGERVSEVSDKVVSFLGRLDEQASDREAFRRGLVEAIWSHPKTGNTISQDLGAYGGLAKDAPRRHRAGKSTQKRATVDVVTEDGWLAEAIGYRKP